jgi:hypothetical protein
MQEQEFELMRASPIAAASLTLGWTICTNRLLGNACAHGNACWFRHFTRIGPIKKDCMAAIRWKSNELAAKSPTAILRTKTVTMKRILALTFAKEVNASRPPLASPCLYSELPETKHIALAEETDALPSPSPKISSSKAPESQAVTHPTSASALTPHDRPSLESATACYDLLPIREKCAIYFMLKILIDGKNSMDDWREEYGIEFGLSFKFVRKYPEMFVMNQTSGSIMPTNVALTCYREVQSQFPR